MHAWRRKLCQDAEEILTKALSNWNDDQPGHKKVTEAVEKMHQAISELGLVLDSQDNYDRLILEAEKDWLMQEIAKSEGYRKLALEQDLAITKNLLGERCLVPDLPINLDID